MEMAQIKYALATAKTLNFTKAARDCNVSQPALTKAVKNLELELGAPLFHREGKRVLLSGFGNSILAYLQQVIDGAESAQMLAKNYRLLNQVPIRLGVMSSVGHVRLARFISRFEKEHRGVELSVTERSVEDLKIQLEVGEIDAAILNPIGKTEEDFHLTPLYVERYVVVFPPEHRLGKLDAVKLSELGGEPYVDRLACELREMVMLACREAEINLYARFRSEREDWIQAMVLAGIGFAFMPEYSVSIPGLLQRPLIEPKITRSISLATMPGRPFSPAVAAFVRTAESFAWPG